MMIQATSLKEAHYLSKRCFFLAWTILRRHGIPCDTLREHLAPMILPSVLIARSHIRNFSILVAKLYQEKRKEELESALTDLKLKLMQYRCDCLAPVIARQVLNTIAFEIIQNTNFHRHERIAIEISQLLVEMADHIEILSEAGIVSALCKFLFAFPRSDKSQEIQLINKVKHSKSYASHITNDPFWATALKALTQIACKSAWHRDLVLEAGGVAAILHQLKFTTSLLVVRYAALALATMCREPSPNYILLKPALPILCRLLDIPLDIDDQIIAFACEALSCLCAISDNENPFVCAIIEIPSACRSLIQFIPDGRNDIPRLIAEPALSCLGNIASSRFCHALIFAGVLPRLSLLLRQPHDLRQYACFSVANFLSNGLHDAVFNENLIFPIANLFANKQESWRLRLEASYALANATVNISRAHIAILIDSGFLAPFLDWCFLEHHHQYHALSHPHNSGQNCSLPHPDQQERGPGIFTYHTNFGTNLLINGLEALRNVFIGLGLDDETTIHTEIQDHDERLRYYTLYQQTERLLPLLKDVSRDGNYLHLSNPRCSYP